MKESHHMRRTSIVVMAAGFAAALWAPRVTHAQPIETLTFSIEWENDVTPTNPTAKGAVWATISPNIGMQVQWNTLPGTGQVGVLMAFGQAVFDTLDVANSTTGTLTWSVPSNWDLSVAGTPDGNGGITQSKVGQIVQPNPSPNTQQKVKLLELAWTTGQFSPRLVEFVTQCTLGKVNIDVGLSVWPGENTAIVNGAGGFWVVPGPSPLWVMALVTVWPLWVRRRQP